MHHHAQTGREFGRLSSPVTHHGGWSDHQGWATVGGTRHMGKHRGGLAQAHVERQTPAQFGSIEEPQPGHGLRLITAQFACEAFGLHHRLGGCLLGAADEVGGPAAAVHRDPTGQRAALEADAVPQDFCARQLRHLGALGQCSSGGAQVDTVELYPFATRTNQRAGFHR